MQFIKSSILSILEGSSIKFRILYKKTIVINTINLLKKIVYKVFQIYFYDIIYKNKQITNVSGNLNHRKIFWQAYCV